MQLECSQPLNPIECHFLRIALEFQVGQLLNGSFLGCEAVLIHKEYCEKGRGRLYTLFCVVKVLKEKQE